MLRGIKVSLSLVTKTMHVESEEHTGSSLTLG